MTPLPTETPVITPTPPLHIEAGAFNAGDRMSFGIRLTEDITRPFDFYLFAETPAGIYTIYVNGLIKKGITPILKNGRWYPAPYFKTVSPAIGIPLSMKGATITLYTLAVDAGKKPPVRSLAELTPASPYVIMFDRAPVAVN